MGKSEQLEQKKKGCMILVPFSYVARHCYSQAAVLKAEEGSPGFLGAPVRAHARLVFGELSLREECHVSGLPARHVAEAADVGVALGQHDLLLDVVALRRGRRGSLAALSTRGRVAGTRSATAAVRQRDGLCTDPS